MGALGPWALGWFTHQAAVPMRGSMLLVSHCYMGMCYHLAGPMVTALGYLCLWQMLAACHLPLALVALCGGHRVDGGRRPSPIAPNDLWRIIGAMHATLVNLLGRQFTVARAGVNGATHWLTVKASQGRALPSWPDRRFLPRVILGGGTCPMAFVGRVPSAAGFVSSVLL